MGKWLTRLLIRQAAMAASLAVGLTIALVVSGCVLGVSSRLYVQWEMQRIADNIRARQEEMRKKQQEDMQKLKAQQ